VRDSEALQKILGTVLAVGNYLNGGTAKGQADGFEIDALLKVTMVKDSTNRVTLLDYVIKLANTQYPESLVSSQ
jgi:hypothetical protein